MKTNTDVDTFTTNNPFAESDGQNLPAPLGQPYRQSAMVPAATDEVSTMVRLAQQGGERNLSKMYADAVRIGRALGADGYYSFPAGASRIEGASVWLMEALEGVWGCTLTQVRIEKVEGTRVTLQARAMDLKTCVVKERPAMFTMSPAPAKFASKPDQVDRWHAMQLQSATSKAARTVLEHLLPAWFVDPALKAAKDAARANVLGGKSLQQCVEDSLLHFQRTHGVCREQLEKHQGREVALWVDLNIADLRSLDQALKSGATTIAEQFPAEQASAPTDDANPRSALGLTQ